MSQPDADSEETTQESQSGGDLADVLDSDVRDRLEENNTRPLWEVVRDMGGHDRSELSPQHWSWETLWDLQQEILDVPREVADKLPFERRALIPVNSSLPSRGSISSSIFLGLQSYPPGDETPPHRHPHTAFRLVTDGCEGMKAVAEGEAIPAHTNDLIATPAWGWHGHKNDGDEIATWISVLDLALMLEGFHLTGEDHWEDVHVDSDKDPIYRSAGFHNNRYGKLLPSNEDPGNNTAPYRFAWEDCYDRLQEAAREEPEEAHDPYNGVTLEYVNPTTGQPPVAPTMSMRLQLLHSGEETEKHKHNSVEAYHVMQGSGTTVVGDTVFEWSEKDIFLVPPMSTHHHAAAEDDTVLYAVSDSPVLRSFDLYREYDEDDDPIELPRVLANHDVSTSLMRE